ncbi:uncharacterized protein LOC125941056 [Dermacentor silvarum]|uniref:uncharacterized protein LOC125941056 n=1 Tax=Dermacentor silvarum TaxID=543639 RepID=UPI0021007D61|nr:uncharacterized protein LOC125941056 [Dermacentor silvarum]
MQRPLTVRGDHSHRAVRRSPGAGLLFHDDRWCRPDIDGRHDCGVSSTGGNNYLANHESTRHSSRANTHCHWDRSQYVTSTVIVLCLVALALGYYFVTNDAAPLRIATDEGILPFCSAVLASGFPQSDTCFTLLRGSEINLLLLVTWIAFRLCLGAFMLVEHHSAMPAPPPLFWYVAIIVIVLCLVALALGYYFMTTDVRGDHNHRAVLGSPGAGLLLHDDRWCRPDIDGRHDCGVSSTAGNNYLANRESTRHSSLRPVPAKNRLQLSIPLRQPEPDDSPSGASGLQALSASSITESDIEPLGNGVSMEASEDDGEPGVAKAATSKSAERKGTTSGSGTNSGVGKVPANRKSPNPPK